MLDRQPNRFGQPRTDPITYNDPVDHRFDLVLLPRCQLRGFVDRVDRAIDPSAD